MEDWYKKAGSRFAHFLHPDLKSAWAGSKEHLPANENILTNSTYKSQAAQGEKAMDMLRQEYKEKDIDKEKEFNRDKINRFGGKKK
ncbi:hypothetical protein [Campylobacter avium]|uniref:hypothetical protein n=1 Tax=Campylobacter avium TaxID=522485 RepID=UPI0023568F81|nr:hypothetical protein [Campylobacter avium]